MLVSGTATASELNVIDFKERGFGPVFLGYLI